MTDLATRIADVKKKAEEAKPSSFWAYRMEYIDVDCIGKPAHEYITTASPSLFIEMADEIDRLKAQLEKAREALEPFAGAWNRAIDFADSLEVVTDELYYSTAARVHAELAEKEKDNA